MSGMKHQNITVLLNIGKIKYITLLSDANDPVRFRAQQRANHSSQSTSLLAEALFLVFADGRKETSAIGSISEDWVEACWADSRVSEALRFCKKFLTLYGRCIFKS